MVMLDGFGTQIGKRSAGMHQVLIQKQVSFYPEVGKT